MSRIQSVPLMFQTIGLGLDSVQLTFCVIV